MTQKEKQEKPVGENELERHLAGGTVHVAATTDGKAMITAVTACGTKKLHNWRNSQFSILLQEHYAEAVSLSG